MTGLLKGKINLNVSLLDFLVSAASRLDVPVIDIIVTGNAPVIIPMIPGNDKKICFNFILPKGMHLYHLVKNFVENDYWDHDYNTLICRPNEYDDENYCLIAPKIVETKIDGLGYDLFPDDPRKRGRYNYRLYPIKTSTKGFLDKIHWLETDRGDLVTYKVDKTRYFDRKTGCVMDVLEDSVNV